jgi:hypothetical protein
MRASENPTYQPAVKTGDRPIGLVEQVGQACPRPAAVCASLLDRSKLSIRYELGMPFSVAHF